MDGKVASAPAFYIGRRNNANGGRCEVKPPDFAVPWMNQYCMPDFDPRSFIITAAVLGGLCSFIFFVLRKSFPSSIHGINEWGFACLLMSVSAVLFALRQVLPTLISSLLGNVLLVAGVMSMYVGLHNFHQSDDRMPKAPMAIALLLIAAVLFWATSVQDSYRGRVIIVTSANAALFAACGVLILRMQIKRRFAECYTACMFFFVAFVSCARFAVALFTQEHGNPGPDLSVIQHVYLATFAISLVGLALGFILMVNSELQRQLRHIAMHDGLTGILARGPFEVQMENEVRRSKRYRQPVSLLVIDLDDFKSINDRYGHAVGDAVLRDFVRRSRPVLRTHDAFARIGGEEFAVLLPNTTEAEAFVVADRLRASISTGSGLDVPRYTVSVGAAERCEATNTGAGLFEAADRALYRAKNSGKNQVALPHPVQESATREWRPA